LEEEDPSGWIKARTIDGREGLIPGSYLGTSGDTESLANDQLVREEDEPVVGQEGSLTISPFLSMTLTCRYYILYSESAV
jgi:hypothetical protein